MEFTEQELKVLYSALNTFVLDAQNYSSVYGTPFSDHDREILKQANTLFWQIDRFLFSDKPN